MIRASIDTDYTHNDEAMQGWTPVLKDLFLVVLFKDGAKQMDRIEPVYAMRTTADLEGCPVIWYLTHDMVLTDGDDDLYGMLASHEVKKIIAEFDYESATDVLYETETS